MKKISVLAALLLLSCNQSKNATSEQTTNPIIIEKPNTVKDSVYSNDKNENQVEDLLIVPGKSIGDTNLLDNSVTLEKFGKPSFSDAAMGKAWSVWPGKGLDALGNKSTLAVYVTYNGSDMSKQVVKRIRITSADFQTAEGAHTGMTFKEIKNLYPNIIKNSKMSDSEFSKGTTFYILKDAGISFEFKAVSNSQICIAIAIAFAKEISNQPYLMLDSSEIPQ